MFPNVRAFLHARLLPDRQSATQPLAEEAMWRYMNTLRGLRSAGVSDDTK